MLCSFEGARGAAMRCRLRTALKIEKDAGVTPAIKDNGGYGGGDHP
jgi:hypothetical protein